MARWALLLLLPLTTCTRRSEPVEQKTRSTDFDRELLDRLATEHPYDRARVYLTGISNGAMMAVRFACERPERVAAISAVAGPGYIAGCTQPKPTAVQLIHGTADGCALYAGGARCGGCWEKATGDWLGIPIPERHFACTSVDDQAAFWRKVTAAATARGSRSRKARRAASSTPSARAANRSRSAPSTVAVTPGPARCAVATRPRARARPSPRHPVQSIATWTRTT